VEKEEASSVIDTREMSHTELLRAAVHTTRLMRDLNFEMIARGLISHEIPWGYCDGDAGRER
jgi:hypothetical protein